MRFSTSCVSGRFSLIVPFADAQIRDGVEPQRVDAEIEPELHDVDHGLDHRGVVEVQVGLMREEAMPVVLTRDRIERPVGLLGVEENDPRLRELRVGVAPDIEAPLGRVRPGPAAHAGTTDAGPTCG